MLAQHIVLLPKTAPISNSIVIRETIAARLHKMGGILKFIAVVSVLLQQAVADLVVEVLVALLAPQPLPSTDVDKILVSPEKPVHREAPVALLSRAV